MEYRLAIEGAPDEVPGGTAVLLRHPSTAETDRIDTDFLKTDTDAFLVVSTRTTAREVKQKLDHYGVVEQHSTATGNEAHPGDADEPSATILDTLSVERGYSRRSGDGIRYVSRPEDVDGIVQVTEEFLAGHDGKRRVSFDSITELAYYADEARAKDALARIVALLEEYDAVGLFHVSEEVHDDDVLEAFEALCSGVIDLAEDGSVTVRCVE